MIFVKTLYFRQRHTLIQLTHIFINGKKKLELLVINISFLHKALADIPIFSMSDGHAFYNLCSLPSKRFRKQLRIDISGNNHALDFSNQIEIHLINATDHMTNKSYYSQIILVQDL